MASTVRSACGRQCFSAGVVRASCRFAMRAFARTSWKLWLLGDAGSAAAIDAERDATPAADADDADAVHIDVVAAYEVVDRASLKSSVLMSGPRCSVGSSPADSPVKEGSKAIVGKPRSAMVQA